MPAVIVTGTDTDVGKTVVIAALAALAWARAEQVAVVKPIQTEVMEGRPGDLTDVRRLSELDDLRELARFPGPVAPRRAGVTPSTMRELAKRIVALAHRDLVQVEGADGCSGALRWGRRGDRGSRRVARATTTPGAPSSKRRSLSGVS